MVQAIRCAECSWPVPADLLNRADSLRCPGCGERLAFAVFPAVERVRAGTPPEAVGGDSEASCFYHPDSRAVTPCDECGRFLCGLCDIELEKKHFCPNCFQSGLSANRLENVETRRTMYDAIALALATWPLLLIWPAVAGAPASLYVMIRHWKTPLSILPRTRIRFYLAALFALAELAGVAALIWGIARLPRVGSS